jgi:Arc/MetJ family transcription regulator
MMRTNVVLDDDLIREAMRVTGKKTKRAVIDEALRLLVRSKKRVRLSDYEGKFKFAPGYDYKRLREERG